MSLSDWLLEMEITAEMIHGIVGAAGCIISALVKLASMIITALL